MLDLGSGIGSVGMIAAWRLPGATFVTIEAQEDSVRLARKSAAYNGLESRYEIRRADFRDAAAIGASETFDLVLGSPPYFPTRHRNRRRPSAEGRVPLRAARRHLRLRARGCRAPRARRSVRLCLSRGPAPPPRGRRARSRCGSHQAPACCVPRRRTSAGRTLPDDARNRSATGRSRAHVGRASTRSFAQPTARSTLSTLP